MGGGPLFLDLFSAESNEELYAAHLHGQARALADFGAVLERTFTSGGRGGRAGDDVSVVVCRARQSLTIVGGGTVHYRRDGGKLPSQLVLGDPRLCQEIEDYPKEQACEIGGVWIAEGMRRRGLFSSLFCAAVAAAHLTGAQKSFSSVHAKSARLVEPLGMAVDYTRSFAWPSERYQTYLAQLEIGALVSSGSTVARMIAEIAEAFARSEPYQLPELGAPVLDTPALGLPQRLVPAVSLESLLTTQVATLDDRRQARQTARRGRSASRVAAQ